MEKKKFELKNNSGTLFLNERKTETKHPDYTGKAVIFGKPCWVSAWIRTSKKGTRYISIAVVEPLPKPPKKEEATNQTFNQKIDNFQQEHKTKDTKEEIPF